MTKARSAGELWVAKAAKKGAVTKAPRADKDSDDSSTPHPPACQIRDVKSDRQLCQDRLKSAEYIHLSKHDV